jgi:hypothetical protein
MVHEIVADLFKNRPSLAAELLVEAVGIGIYSRIRPGDCPRSPNEDQNPTLTL